MQAKLKGKLTRPTNLDSCAFAIAVRAYSTTAISLKRVDLRLVRLPTDLRSRDQDDDRDAATVVPFHGQVVGGQMTGRS